MPENLTFKVAGVDEQGDQTIVELDGTATSFLPDFIVTNRARLKAIRVVGGEHILRGAANEVAEGNLSRVTEILESDRTSTTAGMQDVFIVVAVHKAD